MAFRKNKNIRKQRGRADRKTENGKRRSKEQRITISSSENLLRESRPRKNHGEMGRPNGKKRKSAKKKKSAGTGNKEGQSTPKKRKTMGSSVTCSGRFENSCEGGPTKPLAISIETKQNT